MKKSIIAVILTFTLLLGTVACSTAWVATLDSILAAAAPALINILEIYALAQNTSPNAALESKIRADAATIKVLATDFANASAAAAPGACQQLNAAIGVYSQDQQQVLQLAQVSDPRAQLKIQLLSNLVVGTVAAITAVIPSCQNVALAKTSKQAPPLKMSTFIDDYNAVLVAPTGNMAVDKATPKMKLHRHSTAVRWLSLGFAN